MDPKTEARIAIRAGRPGQVIIAEEPWSYSTGRSAAALAPAASTTQRIQLQADADFLIEKSTYYADNAGAAQTVSTRIIPNVLVQVFYTGQKALWNVDQPVGCVFGSAELPFIWPRPYLIPANSLMEVASRSFEAALSLFLTYSFHGRKIYWGAPEQRSLNVRVR